MFDVSLWFHSDELNKGNRECSLLVFPPTKHTHTHSMRGFHITIKSVDWQPMHWSMKFLFINNIWCTRFWGVLLFFFFSHFYVCSSSFFHVPQYKIILFLSHRSFVSYNFLIILFVICYIFCVCECEGGRCTCKTKPNQTKLNQIKYI